MNKEQLIGNKLDFFEFLRNDNEGKILELFDDEGLNILKNSESRKDRIAYILSYSKYKNELLKNPKFLDIFLNTDISYYYACLRELKPETYDLILDKYYTMNVYSNKFAELFTYMSKEYKIQKIKEWPYGIDIIYKLINQEQDADVIDYIINNYNIDLSDKRIDISLLIGKVKDSALTEIKYRNKDDGAYKAINIPIDMLDDKLAKKLYENNHIFEVRRLISELEKCTNPEVINNYVKNKEEDFISNYTEETIISPYKEVFETFRILASYSINDDSDEKYDAREDFRDALLSCDDKHIKEKLEETFNTTGIDGVYNFLKDLSGRKLSNYIIDYHFEENYHNVTIDIKELLSFYYNGNIILDEEHVDIYQQVLNIDFLSIEERKELHNRLKQIDVMSMFYDDMALARKIVHESIKDASLSRDTIGQYEDKELSEKYGIPVYVMGDEAFFGIVKSGRRQQDELPTGHSYSIVGNTCVTTFDDPSNSKTFLYDAEDLNPDQIVHVFPYDSFTMYKPFETIDNPTNRVSKLLMPDDLTGLSGGGYTELLLLEAGRIPTDMDEKLPELKRIALYCVDKIREQDVKVAQSEGVGIILVSSRKYEEEYDFYKNKYKDFDKWNGNYYNGGDGLREIFEAKR